MKLFGAFCQLFVENSTMESLGPDLPGDAMQLKASWRDMAAVATSFSLQRCWRKKVGKKTLLWIQISAICLLGV